MALWSHDLGKDTLVAVNFATENSGFLLTRDSEEGVYRYWAHYTDGVVERINPPEGTPRPVPDTADRTKRVRLLERHYKEDPPGTLPNPNYYKHASKHTGQMRRMVQCLYSKAQESPFAYRFNKTHGILEYPGERTIGGNADEENQLYALRRFFLIEISSAGVYAAPIDMGPTAVYTALWLSRYKPTQQQLNQNPSWSAYADEISLSWAYLYRNEGGSIIEVLSAEKIAPAFSNGGAWYSDMGWAFSISGTKVSNVVHNEVSAPYEGYYQTRLIDIAIDCKVSGRFANLDYIGQNGAGQHEVLVNLYGHGFAKGELAIVTNVATEGYNGAHIVTEIVSSSQFKFVVYSQLDSPAVGSDSDGPQIANAKGTAKFSASVTVGAAGKVTFRGGTGGTLWVPKQDEEGTHLYKWTAIKPLYRGASATLTCKGPVHVYYDGEEQKVTEWEAIYTYHNAEYSLTPQPPWECLYGENWEIYGAELLTSWWWTGNSLYLTHIIEDCTQWKYTETICHVSHDPDPDLWSTYLHYYGPFPNGKEPEDYNEHPCQRKYRPAWGNGAIGTYSAPRWESQVGFIGAVGVKGLGDAYQFLSRQTDNFGDPVDWGSPWCDWDSWYVCPACGGGPQPNNPDWWLKLAYYGCSQYKVQATRYTMRNTQRAYSSGSSLMMLASDREAIAHIRWQRYTESGSENINGGGYVCGTHVWQGPLSSHPYFTEYEYTDGASLGDNNTGISSSSISTDTGTTYTVEINSPAGLITESGNFGTAMTDFTWWQKDFHEEVQSGLFFMAGGLYYPEMNLPDPYNADNYVTWYGLNLESNGGFAQLDGKAIEVFYGRV